MFWFFRLRHFFCFLDWLFSILFFFGILDLFFFLLLVFGLLTYIFLFLIILFCFLEYLTYFLCFCFLGLWIIIFSLTRLKWGQNENLRWHPGSKKIKIISDLKNHENDTYVGKTEVFSRRHVGFAFDLIFVTSNPQNHENDTLDNKTEIFLGAFLDF